MTQSGSQGAIAPLPATACPQRSAASFWAVLWCLRGTWPACSLPTLTYTRSKEAEPGPRLARTDRRARAEPASEAGAHPAATSFAPSCWGCRRRAACPDCLTPEEKPHHTDRPAVPRASSAETSDVTEAPPGRWPPSPHLYESDDDGAHHHHAGVQGGPEQEGERQAPLLRELVDV